MVTVVNTPPSNSDSSTGWIVGVVLLILLVLVVLFWGGPILRRIGLGSMDTNPPKIDVNVEGGSQNTTTDDNGGGAPNPPDVNIITPPQPTDSMQGNATTAPAPAPSGQ